MSRPTLDSIDMTDSAWLTKLNSNFQKLFDAPLPVFQLTGTGAGAPFTPVFDPLYVQESPAYTFSDVDGTNNITNGWVTSDSSFSGQCWASSTLPSTSSPTESQNMSIGISLGIDPAVTHGFFRSYLCYFSSSSSYNMDVYKDSSIVSGFVSSPGSSLVWEYSGTTVQLFENGVLKYTDSSALSGEDVWLYNTVYFSGNVMENVQFFSQSPVGITFDQDARLFQDCIGVYAHVLYISDGTDWNPLDFGSLDFIADLVPGVATVSDIKDAYNALLGDFQTKGWMI